MNISDADLYRNMQTVTIKIQICFIRADLVPWSNNRRSLEIPMTHIHELFRYFISLDAGNCGGIEQHLTQIQTLG